MIKRWTMRKRKPNKYCFILLYSSRNPQILRESHESNKEKTAFWQPFEGNRVKVLSLFQDWGLIVYIWGCYICRVTHNIGFSTHLLTLIVGGFSGLKLRGGVDSARTFQITQNYCEKKIFSRRTNE